MKYHHAQAERRFREEWRRRFRFYREHGMTLQQILPLYKMDKEEFRSNRRYYEHTVPLDSAEPYLAELSVQIPYNEYNWTDVLPDELQETLSVLPQERLRAYYYYKVCGYTQSEIAAYLSKPQRSISRWIVQIAEIIDKS